MAKTTQELRISLTTKEVGEILRKALADKFAPNASFRVDYITNTVYSSPGDDSGREVVSKIVIIGTIEKEITLTL